VPVKNYTTNVFDVTPEQLDKFSAAYIRTHYDPNRILLGLPDTSFAHDHH